MAEKVKPDNKPIKNKSTDSESSEKTGDGAHRGGNKFNRIAFRPAFDVLKPSTKPSEPKKSRPKKSKPKN